MRLAAGSRSRDELERAPDEILDARHGRRAPRGGELIGRELRLEPIKGRACGEGVRRGQLLVAQSEREEHGGPLLFRGLLCEARADPAQCEKLERQGLRGVRAVERLAEALVRLVAV